MAIDILARRVLGLMVFVFLCFGVAALGSIATAPNIPNWYAGLVKPSWTPPNWIFGPVWSALYFCMAVAAWLVWQRGGLLRARAPLILFGVQLGLNLLWSWIFFGLKMPGVAFLEVVLLWAAIAATILAFWQRSTTAAILMTPYLIWVTFAGALNSAIWRLNS